jgi:yeast amino acid transporter
LIMLFGYKWKYNTKTVHPAEADFYSGKAQVDREEEEFLAREALIDHSLDGKWKKAYHKTVGVIF